MAGIGSRLRALGVQVVALVGQIADLFLKILPSLLDRIKRRDRSSPRNPNTVVPLLRGGNYLADGLTPLDGLGARDTQPDERCSTLEADASVEMLPMSRVIEVCFWRIPGAATCPLIILSAAATSAWASSELESICAWGEMPFELVAFL